MYNTSLGNNINKFKDVVLDKYKLSSDPKDNVLDSRIKNELGWPDENKAATKIMDLLIKAFEHESEDKKQV